jgi:orotate phosphoribosyltransferase-like protein
MESLRLDDAKNLGGDRDAWIQHAEELSMCGYGIGEIATEMDATVAAVKYLVNYWANHQ